MNENETGLSPTAAIIGSIVLFVFSIFALLPVFSSRIERRWRWGDYGEGGPFSRFSQAMVTLQIWAWAIAFGAQGLDIRIVREHTLSILVSSFVMLFIAAITDSIINRKR